MQIIGQEQLLDRLNKYTLQTLPKASIFFGEPGCGKHLIGEYIAERLDLKLVNIEPKVTADDLVEYTRSPINTLYIIDLRGIAEKQQNQFLKFVEEPAETAYFILLANSEIGVLSTLLNRCLKFYFAPYSAEQLKQITGEKYSSELPYLICKTPGQLENLDEKLIGSLYDLCAKFVTSIKKASYANLMSIIPRIDYNKYDFLLFFNMLEFVAYTSFITDKNEDAFKVYKLTNEYKQQMFSRPINKETYILNFLTNIWELTRWH